MRGLALLLSLLLPALPALAGDFATREVIGFSPDGGTFAFEEYGVEDGSGFPYSNIYVIDTAADEWLPGTPFRVRVEDETATLSAARNRSDEAARDLLVRLDIVPRGDHVASNPVTELSADPHRVTFNPRTVVPPIDPEITLTLEQYPLPGPEICAQFGETQGFALRLEQAGRTRTLSRDSRLPESRECPLSYRIGDVLTYYPGGGRPVLAVLILMQQVGFEGPDGRWLAVTGDLR
ncbi:MAG TPA: DUF2259 domain-containing protein [Hyphomicrobiales bacterium]|nr:DUF2259 domain-containing protein [Hyphomicrobiales bacterium]